MDFGKLSLKQLKYRIIFLTVASIAMSTQLAWAVEISPIETAERVERLGTIGILSFTLIMSAIANLYLLRLLGTKIINIIEKSSEAHERTASATERVIEAIEHCKQFKQH